MAKRWTLVAHPNYFRSLRSCVLDSDKRYRFVVAIWDRLQETDDPTQGATPVANEPGRYELKLMEHTLVFDLPEEKPDYIGLLEIY